MLKNIIEFSAKKSILQNKNIHPIPSKLNIPDWFKKLEHTFTNRTIKGCIPVLDSLTAGYILKIPIDVYIEHNVIKNQERTTKITSGLNRSQFNLNVNESDDTHPTSQLGDECPLTKKNKNLPFLKIMNPWTIKTPLGYSCLFLPPLNNSDDRFSIIPAIVDTDSYANEINFPFVINGDKYPVLKSIIKEGTPFVQVIPFKRDNWQMNLTCTKDTELQLEKFKLFSKFINKYKNKWWYKKSWK